MRHDKTSASAWHHWTAPPLVVSTVCLVGCTALGNGCKTPKTANERAAKPPPMAARPLQSENLDPKRASRATVVLRVERVADHGGSKYHWVTVRPLRVLKNTTKARFTKPLRVAHYGGKPGVPTGTSTIYLEPYGDAAAKHWRLLDGDGTVGVSHHKPR